MSHIIPAETICKYCAAWLEQPDQHIPNCEWLDENLQLLAYQRPKIHRFNITDDKLLTNYQLCLTGREVAPYTFIEFEP